MTVYAKQPEINVREKLNELGINSLLPLDKMPSGSVIQMQHATFKVDVNLGHSSYGLGGLRTNQAASGTNNRLEVPVVIGAVDKPRSIERLKYVVRFRSESSSSSVEMPQLVGQPSLIMAMEIRR